METAIGAVIIMTLVLGIHFWRMAKKQKFSSKQNGLQTVNINDLHLNEIVHDELSQEQISRIKNFQQILKEVNETPLEKTIENFKRDINPDIEIAVWEKIAQAYEIINTRKEISNINEKREVYNLLLFRSMMPAEVVLEKMKLQIVSKETAIEYMKLYE
ncbi:MAG: hypothetical protein AAFY76_14795 [Cyanobacteria bacterium J06649_11]